MKTRISLKTRSGRLIITFTIVLVSGLAGISYQKSLPVRNYLEQKQPGLYNVVSVEDGDTITVDMQGHQERVRFIGIDTPELHHPEKPVQCFGEAAREFANDLIDHHPVRLVADPEDDNRDLYGRLLRYVYLPDGTLVNTEIVRQGYGFAYTHFPFTKLEEMRRLEREARTNKRGLWAGCQIEREKNGNYQTNPASANQP